MNQSTGASSNNKSPPSSTAKKRSVPPPTTFQDFGVALVLHLCRKYVLFDIDYKVCIYFILVLFGSFVNDIIPLRRGYFAQKTSFLNVIFVKWCWAWTLLAMGSFVYYTALVYSAGDKRNLRQQLARLIVGTIIWFFITYSFGLIGKRFGMCSKQTYNNNLLGCLTNNAKWVPFDTSGHVFMLIYICLLNAEEMRVFRNWDQIKILIDAASTPDKTDPPELMLLNKREIETVRITFAENTPRIRILFVVLSALNLIWEFMLLISTVYYHKATEKLVAGILAIFFWFITYRVWYRSEFSPGMPGHCKIKYIKDRPPSFFRQQRANFTF